MELHDIDPTLTMPPQWRKRLWHALLVSVLVFAVVFLQTQSVLSAPNLGALHGWFNNHIIVTIMQAWPF